MSDLGLPQIQTTTTPARKERPYVEYTLPSSVVEVEFFDHFKETDLSFGLVTPSPRKMEQAGKLAGQNNILMAKELLFSSIHCIGTGDIAKTRDPSQAPGSIDLWWDMIGPKGRDLITTEFTTMMAPSEEDVNMFRKSRVVRRG